MLNSAADDWPGFARSRLPAPRLQRWAGQSGITEVISRRPQVRVNQLGYLPGRPKQATLISDAQDPVPFAIRDRDGVVVYTGFSRPWSVRPEPTSGLNVHVLDFSGLAMQGAGFRIESADQCSHPFE